MKRLTALALVAVALAAACGSDDDSGAVASDTTAAEASSDSFNDADVTFAQDMIPHHEQAVEMAELAADRAGSDEVKDLASRIEAAQDPEIETMTAWLEDWDEPVDGGGGMEMDDGMEMGGGMMSDEDMESLEDADGADFDQLFLEMMGEHHRGAIEMAETELADGAFADALELAQEIVDTQTAEIAEIEELLGA